MNDTQHYVVTIRADVGTPYFQFRRSDTKVSKISDVDLLLCFHLLLLLLERLLLALARLR